jgi:hypothetical protein
MAPKFNNRSIDLVKQRSLPTFAAPFLVGDEGVEHRLALVRRDHPAVFSDTTRPLSAKSWITPLVCLNGWPFADCEHSWRIAIISASLLFSRMASVTFLAREWLIRRTLRNDIAKALSH